MISLLIFLVTSKVCRVKFSLLDFCILLDSGLLVAFISVFHSNVLFFVLFV